ncbi:MAG: DUF6457 domain-containing protein [Microbacteriaceae bacterium]|nr:DUF6457 domain-containing protein [Microbacteriaceae bacterium]MCL2794477.1 DUF6457 domain-containing protein [Microbacteriaceae bacterium]
MPRELNPEDSARLDEWVAAVADALGVTTPVPVSSLLAIAGDVAHQALRPASPVTGFLLGAALASTPSLSADEALARVREVLAAFVAAHPESQG